MHSVGVRVALDNSYKTCFIKVLLLMQCFLYFPLGNHQGAKAHYVSKHKTMWRPHCATKPATTPTKISDVTISEFFLVDITTTIPLLKKRGLGLKQTVPVFKYLFLSVSSPPFLSYLEILEITFFCENVQHTKQWPFDVSSFSMNCFSPIIKKC